MKTYSRLTLAFLLVILVVPQVGADAAPKDRKEVVVWSDSSGKFKVEATFVELVDDKLVVLKRASDGKVIKVPLDKLDEESKSQAKDLHADAQQSSLDPAVEKQLEEMGLVRQKDTWRPKSEVEFEKLARKTESRVRAYVKLSKMRELATNRKSLDKKDDKKKSAAARKKLIVKSLPSITKNAQRKFKTKQVPSATLLKRLQKDFVDGDRYRSVKRYVDISLFESRGFDSYVYREISRILISEYQASRSEIFGGEAERRKESRQESNYEKKRQVLKEELEKLLKELVFDQKKAVEDAESISDQRELVSELLEGTGQDLKILSREQMQNKLRFIASLPSDISIPAINDINPDKNVSLVEKNLEQLELEKKGRKWISAKAEEEKSLLEQINGFVEQYFKEYISKKDRLNTLLRRYGTSPNQKQAAEMNNIVKQIRQLESLPKYRTAQYKFEELSQEYLDKLGSLETQRETVEGSRTEIAEAYGGEEKYNAIIKQFPTSDEIGEKRNFVTSLQKRIPRPK